MAVFSLIEKLDFNGKNVLPLMTHEGSGLGNSVKDLQKICVGSNVKVGLAVHGAESENSESKVASWAKKSIAE